jgi:hypothetical protein
MPFNLDRRHSYRSKTYLKVSAKQQINKNYKIENTFEIQAASA